MTDTEKILSKVLGQILRGEVPDSDSLSVCDTEDLFACALRNGVLHTVINPVYDSLGECRAVNKYLFADSKNIMNEANQDYAWSEISENAEKQGIDLLMLKGIYIKELYPENVFREMCDIDFLFKPEQEKKLSVLLNSLGYKMQKVTACHNGWFSPDSGITLEAHRVINSQADNRKEYYGKMWSRAENHKEYRHIFHMTHEDIYIHLLLHLRSHIKTESANLRQLADIYVLHRVICNSESFELKLKSLNLTEFSKSIRDLILFLFEGRAESCAEKSEKLADFIMGNLKFGEYDCEAAKEAYLSSGSKLRALLRQVFPPPEKIYNSYPIIFRCKILLPFGYIYRLLQSAGIRKNNLKKKIRLASNVSADAVRQGELTADFFWKYGIK